MNHTFSEVSFEIQGVVIFINWLLCMTTIGIVAYYVLVAKTLPDFKKCCQTKKEEEEEDDPEMYRERVERGIDMERVKVRQDMELQKEFKADLGIE